MYGVKQSREKLIGRAEEVGATLVFYGHTHVAEIYEKNGITLVNPGCLYEYSPQKSFAYVVINNGRITAVINDKIIF